MPGADRDGLTAGPADRLQAVGGAIVALDSGLGHMSEKDNVLRKALVFVQTRLQAKLYSILPDAMRRSVPRNILQRTASGSRFCQQASCLSE